LEGTHVFKNLESVLVDEDGATLVEYALVVSLIAIACIATVTALGAQINTAFTNMTAQLAAA
jgi:pilus assembly protein Flp/PilA